MNQLVIVRDSDHGFYLDGGELGEILLPSREVPEDVEQGDEVEVFVSRDSDDRLVATITRPNCVVGDFAGLQVLDVHPKIGAFLDWEFPKDLLLPYREQRQPVRQGEWVVVRVIVDPTSHRIVATARLERYLHPATTRYAMGIPVHALIRSRTPVGYAAIVDGKHRGLLHESSLSRPLMIGESLDAHVAHVRDDGQVELSLEPVGFGRISQLGERILALAEKQGGHLRLHDRSDPEEIRRVLGTSKKAFKQAVGTLYRQKKIRLGDDGIHLTGTAPR